MEKVVENGILIACEGNLAIDDLIAELRKFISVETYRGECEVQTAIAYAEAKSFSAILFIDKIKNAWLSNYCLHPSQEEEIQKVAKSKGFYNR